MKITKKEYYPLYDKYEKPASTLFHKHICKRLARFFTYYFLRINLSPNAMTLLSFFLVILSSIIINLNFQTHYLRIFIFIILTQFSYVLDCSDGVVARITDSCSEFGSFLDVSLDRLAWIVFFIGIAIFSFNSLSSIQLLIFIISICLYISYSNSLSLLLFYIPSLKGYMKNENKIDKKLSFPQLAVRFIYEFIDTGIMYFIMGLCLLFNVQYYGVIFYGILSTLLILGIYYKGYSVSKTAKEKQ